MSEHKDDGGPAFPNQPLGRDGLPCSEMLTGMTLRDWFATHAREDDIEFYRDYYYEDSDIYPTARYTREQSRYRYADAMMEARSK